MKINVEDEELDKLRDELKVPFSCYGCGKLMYNWDTQYFYRYGVCAHCTISHIEDRELDSELLRDRKKLLNYVKEQILKKTT